MFTGIPSTLTVKSVPWSRLNPRKKYWLAFPEPLCWVTIMPGMNSSISPARNIGRSIKVSPDTHPCEAEINSPSFTDESPRTRICSISPSGSSNAIAAPIPSENELARSVVTRVFAVTVFTSIIRL